MRTRSQINSYKVFIDTLKVIDPNSNLIEKERNKKTWSKNSEDKRKELKA